MNHFDEDINRRLSELIKENQVTKDEFLDLGSLGLNGSEPSLFLLQECVHLRTLNLGPKKGRTLSYLESTTSNPKNHFERIPPFLPISLFELSLLENNISKIENLENLINLKSLNLSSNQITRIENIENLLQLQTLNLSSNQISKIETIESLINLKDLNLSSNQISKIENIGSLA